MYQTIQLVFFKNAPKSPNIVKALMEMKDLSFVSIFTFFKIRRELWSEAKLYIINSKYNNFPAY